MPTTTPADVTDAAIATARSWSKRSLRHPEPRTALLLADVLRNPDGLRFTIDFVDQVLRPEDAKVAAEALGRIARRPAPFLPAALRLGMRRVVASAPRATLPVVRRTFKALVGDLVVDVGGSLGRALARLKQGGARLNVNLLGEAVLGDRHARRRLDQTMHLLARDDVDYVSIKVSSVLGPHAPWAHDATVAEAVARLRPLPRLAAAQGKFVNLDMEEYRDLHITLDVFKTLLSEPDLMDVRAGTVVQTYLKESNLVLEDLRRFAAERVARGGAPIKVRLVKGANLAMETVQAEARGWPSPVLPSRAETDASFVRALDACLRPDRVGSLQVGVASHNVYTLALAWELAKARGVTGAVEFEMLSGMGVPLQQVLMEEVGRLRLYVPVVPRAEYDSAICYLVRRLEENAAPENFMSGAAKLGSDKDFLDREEERFRTAVGLIDADVPARWATQTRSVGGSPFANTPDTDPALPSNQEWAREIHAQLNATEPGAETLRQATVTTPEGVAAALDFGVEASTKWRKVSPDERSSLLHKLGEELESARPQLMAAAASEVGKLLDQSDVEVSEACDFAHYYAELALEEVEGASQVPPRLVLVASPWNFPIAIPLGGVAAALAAGAAVILKPAPPARRIAALLAEACWRAGIPRDVVQLVAMEDGPLGEQLVTDPRVEQVVLTGAAETAELFRSWRPDLPLLAETSGKNAIVVTPSADFDLAAADLVASAFGHAGQKCSASSLGILVGSVARSKRFLNQVLDAAASLRVAWPSDPAAQLGPLAEAPGEKLLRGLRRLEPGQEWLLEPKRIDERLWRPGIRTGVAPGSEFHQVEYFGPVLGLMAAKDLEQAIEWQNGTPFGLTAGIHSLDASQVQTWLDNVAAGNLYVNRSITGAIVRRQPFGGWKRSAVGPGAKAGGPNYLLGFGRWEPTEPSAGRSSVTNPALSRLLHSADGLLTAEEAAWLRRVAADDEATARTEFLVTHDPSGLRSEINALRYLPSPVVVRCEGTPFVAVLREASAATAVGAPAVFSFRETPDRDLVEVLVRAGFKVHTSSDTSFDIAAAGRVRYLGERNLLQALGGSIDVTVHDGPSLPAARVALLPYVREQAVSITNHRFGHPTTLTDHLIL